MKYQILVSILMAATGANCQTVSQSRTILGGQAIAVKSDGNTRKDLKVKNSFKLSPASKLKIALPKSKDLGKSLARGGVDAGGGVGFSCRQESGPNKIYLADTYALLSKLEVTGEAEPVNVVSATAKLLNTLKPQKIYDHPEVRNEKVTLGWMINYRHQQLKFEPNFSGKIKIPVLNDDNIKTASLPPGCTKVQLAVQNIATLTVEQSPLVNQLSWIERGYLELHETLISLRGEPGADTTPIRKEVESLAMELDSAKSQLSQQILDSVPVEICYNKRAKMDHQLAAIRDPGLSATSDSIEKMCTSMFDVGAELYVVGVMSVGWGASTPAPEMNSCIEKINAGVQAKIETLHSFQERCQKVVNDHPVSGYAESLWVEKYFWGFSMLGFEPLRYSPTENEQAQIELEHEKARDQSIANLKTPFKAKLVRTLVPGGNMKTSPTVLDDGTLAFNDSAGISYLISPEGKTLRFNLNLGGSLHKPVLLNQNVIVFASYSGGAHFISPKGTRLGYYKTPTVKGGFFKLDAHPDTIVAAPVVSPDGSFVAIPAEKAIYFLDTKAQRIGQFNCPKKNINCKFGTPAIRQDGTVVVAADSMVYLLSPIGKLKATFKCLDWNNSCLYGDPAILQDGGIAIAASGSLYILNQDGSLRIRAGINVQPMEYAKILVLKDGAMAFNTRSHSLLTVNPDGSARSEFEFPYGSDNIKPALMSDGTLVARAGKYIFFLTEGQPLKAVYQTQDHGWLPDSEVSILKDGTVIVSNGGNKLEFISLIPN